MKLNSKIQKKLVPSNLIMSHNKSQTFTEIQKHLAPKKIKFKMSAYIQNYQVCKEAEKHDSWRKKSIETDWKIMYMIESVGWDLTTVIRTMIHMFKKIDERLNMLSRDIEDIKIQTELRHANYNSWDLKNTLKVTKDILDIVKEKISELEDSNRNYPKWKTKRRNNINKIISGLWDNFQHPNIHVTGVPDGEERREKGEKKFVQLY